MQPMQPGMYPFWFWNGDLTEAEVRWQVVEMAAKGMKGFYIHPRQGLKRPYLSESFFRLVEVAVEAAAECGLTVELYDEYPYPSGVAGGAVALGRPEHLATRLVQERFDVPGGPVRRVLPVGEVLCCRAYPLSAGCVDWAGEMDLLSSVGPVLREDSYHEGGLTPYNRKRYFASSPTPTLETEALTGPHRVFVAAQVLVTGHKYWDHFADVMSREAVERFIELTHERYRARFGDLFGKRIGSIFVDETAPRWSGRVPAFFEKHCGYDLLPLLPALQDESHPEHLRVSADLYRVQYELFCEAFEKPVRDWCRGHDLRYAGEKTSVRLSQLRFMDIPGCDPGHTKAGAPLDMFQHVIRSNARAVASAAYFYGKEGALDECYHSMGWSATLQDAKVVAEGLLLAGIRYLVPHGFFYTTHGLPKHDAPPSFFYQLPAWEHFGALTGRLDRIAAAFEGTHIDARVLVVDPHSGLPTPAQLEVYQRLLHGLLGAHVEFLVADTDILESGGVVDGALQVRDLTIEAVVVPPMRAVEPPLATWLERFEGAGGQVLRATTADECGDLVAELVERVGSALGLRCLGGDGERVYAVTRTDGQRRKWFLLNTAGAPCRLELTGPTGLREVALGQGAPGGASGERDGAGGVPGGATPSAPVAAVGDAAGAAAVAADGTDGAAVDAVGGAWRLTAVDGGWRRDLAPFESALLVEELAAGAARESEAGGPAAAAGARDSGDSATAPGCVATGPGATGVPTVRLAIPSQMSVHPLHRNLLRLGTWHLSLSGGPEGEAPVPAVPLATQLAMAQQAFAPRYQPGFGVMPSWHQPELTAVYRYRFERSYSGPVELVVEPGSLVGDWSLTANGRGPVTERDLAPTDTHVRGSLGADVTALLQPGANELELTVTTDRRDGGLVNPLYLAGDFGVTLEPRTLVERSVEGAFDAWEANGLPFYAGAVEYSGRVDLASPPGRGRVRLDLGFPRPFEDAAEVSLNGGPWHAALWSPYAVTVDAAELRAGANEVRLRVCTSLVRAFDGLRWNIQSHRYEPVDPADPATQR